MPFYTCYFLMPLIHKVNPLAEITDFPNPAALKRRSALEVVRAVTTTVMLSPIPGARRLLNHLTHETPPYFALHKRRAGGKHAVIMVNGFMSQGDLDVSDWEAAIAQKFGRATWYHLDWEAERHLSNRAEHWLSTDGLVDWAYVKNHQNVLTRWHSAMVAAERAGELLAQAILRTPQWRYTLVGHSLGARVIHFALKALAARSYKRIENVYLLGGAVGGGSQDSACWETVASALKGRLFNCYSGGDTVLRVLYQLANAGMSDPIGYCGIQLQHPRIVSYDASARVQGHGQWKREFRSILMHLDGKLIAPAASSVRPRKQRLISDSAPNASTILSPSTPWPFSTSSRP